MLYLRTRSCGKRHLKIQGPKFRSLQYRVKKENTSIAM